MSGIVPKQHSELGSWDYLTTHTRLSPIWCGFAPSFVNYKKGCTRLATTSDKVYQLLAHGLWFSPGTLASRSSTTKTDCHDIAEILLKVALKYKKIKYIILYAVLYTEERLYAVLYTEERLYAVLYTEERLLHGHSG
jgi:hypothetical protein